MQAGNTATQANTIKLQQALALHQQGKLEQAEVLYQEILQLAPQHFDALQLSAAMALQRGDPERALILLDQVLLIRPSHAASQNNRGNALYALKRFAAALESYDLALQCMPDDAATHCNRANTLHQLNQLTPALAAYAQGLKLKPDYAQGHQALANTLRDAQQWSHALASYARVLELKPDCAEAYYYQGIVLVELKRWPEALASYDQALVYQSDNAEVYYERGNVLYCLQQFAAAIASYDQALALRPDYAESHHNRASILFELSQPMAALAGYERALQCKPDYAEAHNHRGSAFHQLGRMAEALHSYEQALQLEPDYVEALNNQGTSLLKLKQPAQALLSYERALQLRPDFAKALNNRGTALHQLNRIPEALQSYQQALQLAPEYAEANFNEGICRLLAGDFKRGWQQCEWRWKEESKRAAHRHFLPASWSGQEDLNNKTILLHSEQGFGDTIQFCRYATQVAMLGATVILEVQAPLSTLLSQIDGVALVVRRGEVLPAFDYHCPLMSLPFVFQADLVTISDRPYLHSTAHKKQQWQAQLVQRHARKVGLAWSGNAGHGNDMQRSIALEGLTMLCQEAADFYCLQPELELAQQIGLAQLPITFFGAALHDFSDTAALMSWMDLVITVDTSVAHLAGAMGKEVWILLPFNPDWRWLLERSDSPWYGSARLFRQTQRGDWLGVLAQVTTALQQLTLKAE